MYHNTRKSNLTKEPQLTKGLKEPIEHEEEERILEKGDKSLKSQEAGCEKEENSMKEAVKTKIQRVIKTKNINELKKHKQQPK